MEQPHELTPEEIAQLTPEQIAKLPIEMQDRVAQMAQMNGLNSLRFNIQSTMKSKLGRV